MRSTPRQKGFSLIESMIVISIVMLLASTGVYSLHRAREFVALNDARATILFSLESARNKAQSGVGAQSHGVYIEQDKITTFEGLAYTGIGTVTKLQGFVTTNLTGEEIIFHRLNGRTNISHTIVLANREGDSVRIDVTQDGSISSQ